MSRNHKTSKKSRANYIYYGADGSRTVLKPGENDVTEAIDYGHRIVPPLPSYVPPKDT